MKNSFLTLLMLSSMAMGATLTYNQYEEAGLKNGLVSAWSFDSGNADNASSLTWNGTFAESDKGTGYVGSVSDTRYVPYADNTSITSSFTSKSFTLSLDLVSYETNFKWKNIFTLYAGDGINEGNSLVLTKIDDTFAIYSYGFGDSSAGNMSEAVTFNSDSTPINFTVTYDGTNLVTYINGELSMTTEVSSSTGLQGVHFGSGVNETRPIDSDYRGTNYAELDNIALWNTALTANQVKMIATGEIIPEPATATLSLLALSGLAMRRRRK